MVLAPSLQRFAGELERLAASFAARREELARARDGAARLRRDFLDPFFRALGWDLENERGLVRARREVERERRAGVDGKARRADYLFRAGGRERFVCQARQPGAPPGPAAYHAKRYAWNKGLAFALLTDFEELQLHVVGGRPRLDCPDDGLWRRWRLHRPASAAGELWALLGREAVGAGALEAALETLPGPPRGRSKGRPRRPVRPERARAVEADLLAFLDGARRTLASELVVDDRGAERRDGASLTAASRHVLDRLLLHRLCEDRGLAAASAGRLLPPRPAGPPAAGGALAAALAADDSPYLFHVLPLELLGSVHERFLGDLVRPRGRGVAIEERPEVRKAGGVYYTPRHVVDHIVEATVGALLRELTADGPPSFGAFQARIRALRILDPACGSGAFLLRAFERLREEWEAWLLAHPEDRSPHLCRVDPDTGDVHLTRDLERTILRESIHGVDVDPRAVELTRLSLCLALLEGEDRAPLGAEGELLPPALAANVKCGNALIAPDFSAAPEELARVRPFDWAAEFPAVLPAGFHAVVGNPPYLHGRDWAALGVGEGQKAYLGARYATAAYQLDLFSLFMEKAIALTREGGWVAQIVPNVWLTNRTASTTRRHVFERLGALTLTAAPSDVFAGITVDTVIYSGRKGAAGERLRLARLDAAEASPVGDLPCSEYASGEAPITMGADLAAITLARDALGRHPALGDLAEITRGVHPYRKDGFGASAFHEGSCQTQRDVDERPYHSRTPRRGWRPFVYGKDLGRYEPARASEFVRYGPWLAEPRDPAFFAGPRLYSRKILGERLVVTYEDSDSVADQQVYVTKPIRRDLDPRCLLGILGSRFVAFFIRAWFDERTRAFPQIKVSQLRQVPIALPSDRATSDRLITLVDGMLALGKRARRAAGAPERAAIEDARAATDLAIDALVYRLYALSPREIELVEAGTSAGASQAVE